MKEQIKQVKQFMTTAGQSVAVRPVLLPKSKSELRYELGLEELIEYRTAAENGDLVEIADSLGDQLYILLGTALSHGLQDHLAQIFNEIQRSNMTKFHDTESEANETLAHYHKINPNESHEVVEMVGKFVVFNSSGKVKKNIKYSPANLVPILTNFGFSDQEILEVEKMGDAPHPKNKKPLVGENINTTATQVVTFEFQEGVDYQINIVRKK